MEKMMKKEIAVEEDYKSPVVLFPRSSSEVNKMARILLEGRSIIVNLTSLEIDSQLRVIDYLSGVSFVIGAKRERLDRSVYLFQIG